MKKLHTRYLKKTHKFGIEIPKTVKEAAELDAKNGDTKWMDAISKEMTNVRVAFDILKDGDRAVRLLATNRSTAIWSMT